MPRKRKPLRGAARPMATVGEQRPSAVPGPPSILLGPGTTEHGEPEAAMPEIGPRLTDVPLDFVRVPFPSVADVDPQALGVSYRFALPPSSPSPPMRLTVRGRHRHPSIASGATTFTLIRDVPALRARGDATITVRALDVALGDWEVSIEPELLEPNPGWLPPRAWGIGRTGFAPVIRSRAPGVVLGAWPALVLLGVLLGTLTMTALAARLHVSPGRLLVTAVISSILGAAGAKGYFLALHRDRQAPGLWQTGMAIQGFVLVMLGSMAMGSVFLSLPVGRVLDVSVAGLLVGMTVGRIGCLYGGCCAGRPTSSRWGRWSSDRDVGIRRIPTQLLESAGAGFLAAAAGLVLWNDNVHTGGLVAVAGLAGYTALRQVLFPLRSVPRTTRHGRSVVLIATLVIVVAVVALALQQG